tara:strand:- start:786 stop:1019 length:234 start_codon:yes stop_codon:yes gene_type:complete
MLQVNIWEELVRIREVMALDSYARQLMEIRKKMDKVDINLLPPDRLEDRIERDNVLAEELDKVRNDMRKYCYPEEHL